MLLSACNLDSPLLFSSYKPLANDDFGASSRLLLFRQLRAIYRYVPESDRFFVCSQKFRQNECGLPDPALSFQSLEG